MIEALIQQKTGIIQALVLLSLSGFFSCSETAFFSLSKLELVALESEKSRMSKAILRLFKDPSKLLVSILFGNLAVNILFFSYSTVLISNLGKDQGAAFQAISGIFVLITVIVFGEVLPKATGLSYSLKMARLSIYPLLVWDFIVTPFRIVLSWIAEKLEPEEDEGHSHITPNELKMLMNISKDEGNFNFQAGEVIDDIVELSTIKAREVMKPRVDVVMCSTLTRVSKAIQLGVENKSFYIPVYQGSENNPVGVVNVKELFLSAPKNNFIRPYVKPLKFVPETKKVGELLDEMIAEQLSVVGVVDEYGGLEGVINIRYILEQVVGKMNSRFSSPKITPVVQLGENRYRILGELLLKNWDDFFYDELFEEDEMLAVTTIGGFLTYQLEHIPQPGDVVEHRNLRFTVECVSHNKVDSAILEIMEGTSDA